MSISDSRLAYNDCEELFERAMNDPKGCRLFIGPREMARYFVMRMHKCRQINARDNARIWPEGHPLHGASPWARIKCSIKEDYEGYWYVYAEKVELDLTAVEMLSEIEGEFEVIQQVERAEQPKMLEHNPTRRV